MSAADKIRALEERRAKNRAAHEEAHAEQFAKDFERVIELEEEHGFERVLRIDVGGWKPDVGAATLVVLRVPTASEKLWKRYEDTVAKAKPESTTRLTAAHVLGEACLLYPSKSTDADMHKATMELASGILSNAALQVAKVVQGNAEEEKKG